VSHQDTQTPVTLGSVVLSMSSKRPVEVSEAPPATIEAVFAAEEAPLVRYAYGLVGRREVAEELVQDAFMRLHQQWEQVEKPRAWLYRCVRNRAYNHTRDNKREYLSGEVPERAAEKREGPDEVLRKLEAAGMVHMLLAEMDERDRELIQLKYFEELKYATISERTGMSIGNVGYRLHHILKSLADSMRRAGIEGGQP
jgi:RNA polymerase sigma factor (sigma-70 family)